MKTRLTWMIVDCGDPERLAAFWSQLLDRNVKESVGPYVFLEKGPSDACGLAFQKVDEPKPGKNRVHPDLTCDDVWASAKRVEELGGHRVQGYEEGGFLVMADPEGNEFCLVPATGDNMDEHGNAHYLHDDRNA
jgi:predicted enzyme related to lactoylglutathione lyase